MQSTSHFLPSLRKPQISTTYGLKHLIQTPILMQYAPYMQDEIDPSKPRRKSMVAPPDRNTFVKPIKQSFIKNPRLSPMTRIMLTLLSGWAGQGGTIETTVGIIGKHLSRCRRQVHRYLKDAVEEGYLSYSRTKDRLGYYTGIKIWLNFGAIRFTKFQKHNQQSKKTKGIQDVTLKSETNTKHIYNTEQDEELMETLARFALKAGFLDARSSPP